MFATVLEFFGMLLLCGVTSAGVVAIVAFICYAVACGLTPFTDI